MTWRGVALQTLVAMVLWGLGMTWVFGWPREAILTPMVMFGLLMFAVLGTVKLVKERGGKS
ncbi:hypothetical protein [Pseudotabrizicola sp. L79]|uniref:hypothetical protein n=1 Tax=Pseudotabrizicola sp. L79 TaxID=3118402 RepID=UPI002F942956